MANARKLAELSMATPLAQQVATQIDGAVASKAEIAALVALTDNSTGTSGGNTIAAVSDVATAANAIATFAAKLNAVIAGLKA